MLWRLYGSRSLESKPQELALALFPLHRDRRTPPAERYRSIPRDAVLPDVISPCQIFRRRFSLTTGALILPRKRLPTYPLSGVPTHTTKAEVTLDSRC